MICEFSGNNTFKLPNSVAPIILILGAPILDPGISCITKTVLSCH